MATSTPSVQVSPTPPKPTPLTVTSVPTSTRIPEPDDTGWRTLAPGVEWRRLSAKTQAGHERLHLTRVDPDQVRLRIVYQPSQPKTISQWKSLLPEALVVTNAGYFTDENQATGLIVSDGIASGRSFGDFAGMLAVSADAEVTLRWLQTWPYSPDEQLAQAIQSFPVLVKPGAQMGFPSDADEGQISRRTVVAQDAAGRLLLLASPEFRFSLHELAVWLTKSDLDVDIALNLDGGTSTGLWTSDPLHNVDSLVPVPAVIVIEPLDG